MWSPSSCKFGSFWIKQVSLLWDCIMGFNFQIWGTEFPKCTWSQHLLINDQLNFGKSCYPQVMLPSRISLWSFMIESLIFSQRITCLLAKLLYLCPTLCNLMDPSPPGSSVQGRILKWAVMSSSRGSPDPGIEPVSPAASVLAGRFFTTNATQETLMIT